MNEPNLDKAATRIQASYRGYKTRKQLSLGSSQDQLQHQSEDDNAHNKSRISIFNIFHF
jgi:IQ calmodulin-binding motif